MQELAIFNFSELQYKKLRINMLKSLFRIALRNLTRDASYSLINILGLTIGITGSFFLLLYVFDDLSFDRFHEKADRIYRISSRFREPDDAFSWAVTQVPLGPQLMTDYPEVEEAVRLYQAGRNLYKSGETQHFEEEVSFADSNIFRVFTIHWVEGNPGTALTEPNSIVLTRSFSERYFGNDSPLGKELITQNGEPLKVTGLIEDTPHNTNYRYSALISWSTLPENLGSWGSFFMYTYVLLQEGYDYREFEAKLPMIYENHMAEIFERMGIQIRYEVLPVTRIHLHSDFEGEPVPEGNISYVYIFIAIIVLLLVIASMNYMNLATARSTKRAKEIGIRKVSGSSRSMLVRQFLAESLVLAVLSLIISLVLCYILMPAFNNISGKEIGMESLLNPAILFIMAGIVVFAGLLGGSYPAAFLSAFRPAEVLKGELNIGSSNLNIRKILIVAQFSLSTFLVISTWIVYDQLNYLKNMDIGFDKENVLVLSLNNNEMVDKLPVLKQDLLANPNILNAGSANTRIGRGSSKTIMRVETDDGMVERGINNILIDHDFIDAVGIRLLEGRGFSVQFPADTATGVIINQTLARRLNWDQPIGKKVNLPGDTATIATVVGLIADYHQFGLYNVMEDQMFLYYPRCFRVFVRFSGQQTGASLAYIEQTWKNLFPEIPFEYYFLDEDFGEQFQADEKRGIVFTFFSILTVIIACLGLFGLSSFISELRTKEIGIRKVHGAGVNSITGLMLGSFLILVAIAIVIASAGAYFFAGKWLESFVYRTEIQWVTFIWAAILTVIITILTVGFHTISASQVNPAESLRDE